MSELNLEQSFYNRCTAYSSLSEIGSKFFLLSQNLRCKCCLRFGS